MAGGKPAEDTAGGARGRGSGGEERMTYVVMLLDGAGTDLYIDVDIDIVA